MTGGGSEPTELTRREIGRGNTPASRVEQRRRGDLDGDRGHRRSSRPLARRPAILHGLWLLVLIKLVTPPIYEVPIPWPLSPAAPSTESLDVAMVDVIAATAGEIDAGAGEFVEAPCLADGRRREDRAPLCRQPHSVPTSSGLDRIDSWRWIGTIWLAGSLGRSVALAPTDLPLPAAAEGGAGRVVARAGLG